SLGPSGGFAGFGRPAGLVILPEVQCPGSSWRSAALLESARGATVVRVLAGQVLEVAGFRLEVIAPEAGAPGNVIGAGDLAMRVVGPSGRSFCYLSDLDAEAQMIAAARLRGPCTYLLLPSGGQTAPAPDLIAAAGRPELIASLASGRLGQGLPATVRRTDQEGTITMPM